MTTEYKLKITSIIKVLVEEHESLDECFMNTLREAITDLEYDIISENCIKSGSI